MCRDPRHVRQSSGSFGLPTPPRPRPTRRRRQFMTERRAARSFWKYSFAKRRRAIINVYIYTCVTNADFQLDFFIVLTLFSTSGQGLHACSDAVRATTCARWFRRPGRHHITRNVFEVLAFYSTRNLRH